MGLSMGLFMKAGSVQVSGPQFQDCMKTPALFGPLVNSVLFLSMTVGGLTESSGSKTFALCSWQKVIRLHERR